MNETYFLALRQKYYFIDYSTYTSEALKLLTVISRLYQKIGKTLLLEDIVYARRPDLKNNDKKAKPIFIPKGEKKTAPKYTRKDPTPVFLSTARSIAILRNSGLLICSDLTSTSPTETLTIQAIPEVTSAKVNIYNSDFAPIPGTKQQLTDNMESIYKNLYTIDYPALLTPNNDLSYSEQVLALIPQLEELWSAKYQLMKNSSHHIIRYPTDTSRSEQFDYYNLFDFVGFDEDTGLLSDSFVEERAVCNYGFSSRNKAKRSHNDSRMRTQERRFWSDKQTDRGHFLAHAIGGNIYSNIFPQKRAINQGRSARGKLYRKMEAFLAKNPGTFCFARPIYFDFSNRPYLLEFGYLNHDYQWIIETFDNV